MARFKKRNSVSFKSNMWNGPNQAALVCKEVKGECLTSQAILNRQGCNASCWSSASDCRSIVALKRPGITFNTVVSGFRTFLYFLNITQNFIKLFKQFWYNAFSIEVNLSFLSPVLGALYYFIS